mmetsp:Transcript_46540/g.110691  ORF Transcript_46540/g.110691 Transcript_46540/m.110691 type:complete len:148 (-) Transcript_46540:8-451(-)
MDRGCTIMPFATGTLGRATTSTICPSCKPKQAAKGWAISRVALPRAASPLHPRYSSVLADELLAVHASTLQKCWPDPCPFHKLSASAGWIATKQLARLVYTTVKRMVGYWLAPMPTLPYVHLILKHHECFSHSLCEVVTTATSGPLT